MITTLGEDWILMKWLLLSNKNYAFGDEIIIRRIHIVETFIIPIFLYKAILLCLDHAGIHEGGEQKMFLTSFGNARMDKVKRSVLVDNIEDGGLKAPHLKSIIENSLLYETSQWRTE